MKVVFFMPLKDDTEGTLNRMIEDLKVSNDLEIYRSIESLSERLCQPGKDELVAVIMAVSREVLREVVSIKELLSSLKFILVLPDREDETIAQGHMLRPRFVTYADSDPVEIHAVINKMIGG